MSPLRAASELLDLVGVAALLIGPNGEVLKLNARAQQKLKSIMEVTDSRLTGSDRTTQAAIKNLARTVADGACTSLMQPVAVQRPEELPVILYGLRFDSGAQKVFEPMRGLLVVLDPRDIQVPSVAKLQAAFGLTPAEAKLAIKLTTGDNLAVAARASGIGYESARSLLKAVFQKTGTNRQAELVMLISRIGVKSTNFD